MSRETADHQRGTLASTYVNDSIMGQERMVRPLVLGPMAKRNAVKKLTLL